MSFFIFVFFSLSFFLQDVVRRNAHTFIVEWLLSILSGIGDALWWVK